MVVVPFAGRNMYPWGGLTAGMAAKGAVFCSEQWFMRIPFIGFPETESFKQEMDSRVAATTGVVLKGRVLKFAFL
jgi:hypothetical protein